jgi:hypothetical protein
MQFSTIIAAGALLWTAVAVAELAPAPTARPELEPSVEMQRRMFSASFPGVTASIGWNGLSFLILNVISSTNSKTEHVETSLGCPDACTEIVPRASLLQLLASV